MVVVVLFIIGFLSAPLRNGELLTVRPRVSFPESTDDNASRASWAYPGGYIIYTRAYVGPGPPPRAQGTPLASRVHRVL